MFKIRRELSNNTNWSSSVDPVVERLVQAMEKTLTLLSSSQQTGWNQYSTEFEIRAEVISNGRNQVCFISEDLNGLTCEVRKLIYRLGLIQPRSGLNV